MLKSFAPIALAIATTLVGSKFAQGQTPVSASYSFTSGGNADGFAWLAYQIARQHYGPTGNPSGLTGDQANTPQFLGFSNFTANPAYFNSNNLLTRAANLINNQAWWTDVKTKSYIGANGNTFQTTSWLISCNQINPVGRTSLFGFDFAVASVSGPVATSLPLIVRDNLGLSKLVTIDLDNGNQWTESIGNFFTLNSPHVGYEARIRLPVSVMGDIAVGHPNYNPATYGLYAVTLMLDSYHTLGGTTQVALDNFIAGSGQAHAPSSEPVAFQNIQPVGANTPTYVSFASEENTSTPTTTYVDMSSLPEGSGVDVSINFANENAPPTTLGISFSSDDLPPDGSSIEATHQPGDTSIDADSSNHLGTISTLTDISSTTAVVTVQAQMNMDEMSAEAYSDPTVIPNYAPDPNSPELLPHELVHVVQQRGGPEEAFGYHFANYTYSDYLGMVGTPTDGDSGYSLVPILDSENTVLGYDIDAWVVGLNSGSISLYYNSSVVPEPTALTILGALGALGLRRR